MAAEATRTYRRRTPEASVLHGLVREHLERFLEAHESAGAPLPRAIERQFRNYLGCGLLAHGFVRGECRTCRVPRLVAFSCKGRTLCPSCGARRMAAQAAHLVDRVLPMARVRQWVLSLPFVLRWPLATQPKFLSVVLRIFLDEVFAHYTGRDVPAVDRRKRCGAAAFIHRFDSALNLNVHFHVLVLDGQYSEEDGEVVFTHVRAPTQAQVRRVSAGVARRVHRLAIRWGIIDDTGEPLWGGEDDDAIRPEPWAFGWLTEHGDPIAAVDDQIGGGRESSAEVAGFSVHAGTVVESGDVDGRERLCRYVARPPVANEQLSRMRDGRVALRLSRPKRNGATHAFMSPEQLLRRLATLMPRAGQNLIRYAGVLAANSALRSRVVPVPRATVNVSSTSTPIFRTPRASDIDWATLLKRVYDVDGLRCPCGGQIRIIALIEDPVVARKILDHLGLDTDTGDPAAARGPPVDHDAS